MLGRICFTLKAMRLKKSKLSAFWHEENNKIKSLSDLPMNFCEKRNIKVLVLDFDGVLAAHGEHRPIAKMHAWLETLMNQYPELKVCVLSNNPLFSRQQFFKDHFASLIWISGVPKKPYPDGLLKIIHEFKVAPKEVCLIDDRLLTGILAAELAGVQAILVTKPVQAIGKHLFKECFFVFLRAAERWYIKF